ncbi:MAG: 23S rRNA pseudouridine(955/2504/2580) synthase RluC [Pseudomonadota bacterium]|nr:23S rRNA pseudouridine(955/2504/2580) synthase RluC [Pseudomonadota bacterium]
MSSTDKRPSVAMVTVTEDQHGQRLDNFLVSRLKGVPKSAIYRMIRKGEVRVNKGRTKPEYKLSQGDLVRVPPARTKPVTEAAPFVGDSLKSQLEAAILYEDDGLIVINKPSGLAVHGGSGVSLGVIEALRQMRPAQRFLELVHRLDRDTSGCLMVAKKRSVLKKLHDDLRQGNMQKTYLALLWGRWNGLEHRIEAPLRKFQLASGERIVRVSADGKPSLTLFRQLELYSNATLVEAKPVTGRTHQIRVHAQFAGHPIAGDDKYLHREQAGYFEEKGLKRLFLHAAGLELEDAAGQKRVFNAPMPEELNTFLSRL